jgi:hypothetical protein
VFEVGLALSVKLPAAMPVPVRVTVCGLIRPLSVIAMVPLRVPVTVGVNVTLIVQLAPAERLVPQVFVTSKSEEFDPAILMLEMARLTLPVFDRVTV